MKPSIFHMTVVLPPTTLLIVCVVFGLTFVGCGRATSPVRAWSSCLLDEVPTGACGGWGPPGSGLECNPDRFLDQTRLDYVPDETPPGLPLIEPIRVHWHILLQENGQGDISDAIIDKEMAGINKVYGKAGIHFVTEKIHRHQRPDLARCKTLFNEKLLTDPNFSVCGTPAATELAIDTERFINIYVLDFQFPSAFATYPCLYPPGDNRDGLFFGRAVFSKPDKGVVAHELAHYFGLLHPFHTWNWADSPESICQDEHNDFVKDTVPQVVSLSWAEQDYCVQPPTSCKKNSEPDQVFNFMQYSKCLTTERAEFTPGQYRRIQWTLINERAGLIQSQ